MEELIIKIQTLTGSLAADLSKFNDGNKAAGARARKATLELEKLYKQFRKESVAASK